MSVVSVIYEGLEIRRAGYTAGTQPQQSAGAHSRGCGRSLRAGLSEPLGQQAVAIYPDPVEQSAEPNNLTEFTTLGLSQNALIGGIPEQLGGLLT